MDELLLYLLGEHSHPLAQPLTNWLATSRRFATFATTFRDKIRKKIRAPQDQASLLDLRLELETAYLLLQERTLSVVYEPEPPRQVRCPDFAVTFTTSHTFMVEVTRLRTSSHSRVEGQPQTPTSSGEEERLIDTICSKLGQLLAQRSNVLLIGTEALVLTSGDLRTPLLTLQQRAERNDAAFLRRHGFVDRGDFFRHFQRLSEILVRRLDLPTAAQPVGWVNPQAKHPLPGKVHTVLYRSQTGA